MKSLTSCYFEPYLVLIFVSSALFSIFFFVSILQSDNMIQKPCNSIPNVTISHDFSVLINRITNSIQNAHTKVQLSFSAINLTIFEDYLLPALQVANNNGAKVMMVFTSDKKLDEILKQNPFIETFPIDSSSQQVSAQSIVVDDMAFISPFIVADNSRNVSTINQLITVEKCDSIAKDIASFVEYGQNLKANLASKVLSGKFIAQTSANRPANVKIQSDDKEKKNSKISHAFMFHNPQNFLIPNRVATNNVLLSLFDKDPSFIDIYTLSPQCFSSLDDPESNQLTVYMALKSLLMRNKTKIRYLASKPLFKKKKSTCFTSFLTFDNSEIHLYDKQFEGLNYIVAHFNESNDESYIFSQSIDDHEFVKMLSLHLATDDEKTAKYLKDNFDSVWNYFSSPVVIETEY